VPLISNPHLLYAKTEFTKDAPLNVTSDSMVAKKASSTVEFKGNVVVTRDDSIIHADSITMFFIQTEAGKKNENKKEIEKIVAIGHVKYLSGERRAFANKAVYTFKNEILVLTGNLPKVITGENSVTGEKITLSQKDGRIIIEGGVNATFNPDTKNEQKKE